MDGVAMVSQKPIPPGGVFHYHFTLKQSGTYWYHAHAGLQEQQGLYGAIIIDPIYQRIKYNKDFVIVLSDWSNTNPEHIFDNLKKDGDFYSPKFPTQPSLLHFIQDYRKASPAERKKLMHAYHMMQKMRMNIYDISDIAYDTFLMNGRPPSRPWVRKVHVGDIVRLRFIDAGASTLFHIKIPGTIMKMIHVEGNDVRPYSLKTFTIAPGETYDVLVKIIKKMPYIIYAESADKVGAVYGALTTATNQIAHYNQVNPFPNPQPVIMEHQGSHKMSGHNTQHQMDKSMHQKMTMNALPTQSTPTKYDALISTVKTNNPNKPFHVIKVMLSGNMDRYGWFMNGVPEYKAKPILIQHGKRYRIIFTNDTMMHHPMHLHGHWFILRNGHGAYDPLFHTIDVPPNATIVADFDADSHGQWYFHCHNLYHMKAGMANILRYTTQPKQNSHTAMSRYSHKNKKNIINPAHYLPGHKAIDWYAATRLEASADFFHSIYKASLNSLIGPNNNKLQLYSEDAEMKNSTIENADLDIFYWRTISQFWAVKGGINYFYRPSKTPYLQPGVGIEGLMPYFIETNLRSYWHKGSFKFDLQLARDTQLTNNFFLRVGIRSILATKNITRDEIGRGVNDIEFIVKPYYRLTPNFNVYAEYEHTEYYDNLKRIRKNDGQSTNEHTISLGISTLF